MDDETDGQHDAKYYVVAIHHDTEEACVLAHTNYKETIFMYEAAKRAQAQLDELKVQIKEDELKRSYAKLQAFKAKYNID